MTTLRSSRTRRGKPAAKPADRYHHGDLRSAILATARRRLAEAGPEALSLRDIARALEVSHNAPYRHFASREALLGTIAADGFRELTRRAVEAQATAEPQRRLRARGVAYVGFALEQPSVFRLMFSPQVRGSGHAELAEAALQSFAALREAVQAELQPERPEAATLAAWSLVHGLAHLLIDGQLPPAMTGQRTPAELAEAVIAAMGSRKGDRK